MPADLQKTSQTPATPDLGGRNVLFCVGAQKAGTSWLHDYLSEHPEVHVPAVKEMHYFDGFFGPEKAGGVPKRRRENYKKLPMAERIAAKLRNGNLAYPSTAYLKAMVEMHDEANFPHQGYANLLTNGAGPATCVADVTPSYALIGEDGFREMLAFSPGAHFLYILRDPVSRVWSALRMVLQNSNVSKDELPAALAEKVDLFLKGRQKHVHLRSAYSATMDAMEAVIPADQRLYVIYEEMFRDETVQKLTDFFGVSPHKANFDKVVRKGVQSKMDATVAGRLRAYLDDEYLRLERRLGRLPEQWTPRAAPAAALRENAK
ncbi:Sulfotransferase domain protein [Shimia sp. SK013]|uniref:sulfotransferase family protein n=1 Tax=Shimia sp. SK013 TaxID=1389006 RepID=UPI0006B512D4|nr:sulfotransferase [Shimia sp. SK013]KPA23051.1 Sulfotransferase domain protein [Shimia sp. SK013]